jgi:BolA protein
MDTKDKIEQILKEHFDVIHLEIEDLSHLHAGHADVKESGGGHYKILIVSDDFYDQTSIQRHRAINQALKHEFKNGIHALSIKAFTGEEFQN